MAISQAIGIDMPLDFATDAHNSVVQRLGKYQKNNAEIWSELAGGWNAVAHRFNTMANADQKYTASLKLAGSAAPPDHRVIQEEALFAFFVAGYAALESLGYAAFAMGALLRPADFPMVTPANRRAVTPNAALSKFSLCFPGTQIETRLSALIVDPNFKRWGLIRNVLAHRSAPARHHHMSVGSQAPHKTEWEISGGLTIDDRTTSKERPWLATMLAGCLEATADFARANFP